MQPMREETIPVPDLGAYLAGGKDADHLLAEQLREASETIGFYFIRNPSVEQALIDWTFAEAARFHALPMEQKQGLLINKRQIGYRPMDGAKMRLGRQPGENVLAYWARLEALGQNMLPLYDLALGHQVDQAA